MNLSQTTRRQRYSRKGWSDVMSEFEEGGRVTSEHAFFLQAAARFFERLSKRGSPEWQDGALNFARKFADYLGLAETHHHLKTFDEDTSSPLERRRLLARISADLKSQKFDLTHSALAARLEFLGDILELDPTDQAILAIAARYRQFSIWSYFFNDAFTGRSEDMPLFLAILSGVNADKCRRTLARAGVLRSKGLLESRSDINDLDLSDYIQAFLDGPASNEREMFEALLPTLPTSSLALVDFEHLIGAVDQAEKLLCHAKTSRKRANLLLYGPPGTGKTELAKLLADRLEIPAISVGEADDDGDEPSREERLLHLTIARKLTERRTCALLIIDEAEDLFAGRGSKLWLNKLVEDGVGPHIWIVNDPHMLGEPVVRRMDMAIRLDFPSTATRRAIVTKLLTQQGMLALSKGSDAETGLAELAALETSPAILSTALQTSQKIGKGITAAVHVARDLTEASGRNVSSSMTLAPSSFDPDLSVANCDLMALTEHLSLTPMTWSLLLSGPPGTGKSAFARHIAERIGCDLICRSGAELLGMYVGQTEKLIARAFAEAQRKNAILLIDEADSFLSNRDMANRNWEISMTNEMLRQMEGGRARFIATTNRASTFDPASARRFDLQAEFGTLDRCRARRLYSVYFDHEATMDLDTIEGLTPGDFSQVRNRARLLNEAQPDTILKWLRGAVEDRSGVSHQTGFDIKLPSAE